MDTEERYQTQAHGEAARAWDSYFLRATHNEPWAAIASTKPMCLVTVGSTAGSATTTLGTTGMEGWVFIVQKLAAGVFTAASAEDLFTSWVSTVRAFLESPPNLLAAGDFKLFLSMSAPKQNPWLAFSVIWHYENITKGHGLSTKALVFDSDSEAHDMKATCRRTSTHFEGNVTRTLHRRCRELRLRFQCATSLHWLAAALVLSNSLHAEQVQADELLRAVRLDSRQRR
ncbi:hypothetical protein BKA62DRAFT_759866 [Auriculariales sp. MPI-PUGE-AT-0066]|nr:hypothetical protein BKA62DRAFT_759866 [Auriculariales sp. MPI-PUGE-AT-0066]